MININKEYLIYIISVIIEKEHRSVCVYIGHREKKMGHRYPSPHRFPVKPWSSRPIRAEAWLSHD